MEAFLNKEEVKEIYINRVKDHQKSDEIIKGKYWENGKGCAVGCTVHSSNHNAYETELGIPSWLAHVEDALFEGMSTEKSKTWPFEFLNAIKVGVDLDKSKASFQIMVLESVLNTLENNKFCDTNFPSVIKSITDSKEVVNLLLGLWRSGKINDESAESAESAARSAARSAESAESAASAAWSAASAARSAASAAWSAASAASTAWSAASAASAAWSAESAAESAESAAESAESAAWSAASTAYDQLADGLIEIIKNIK